jgi:hypothetical protein
VPTLLAEVTRVQEVVTIVEAACRVLMLAAETSAREAVAMQDSATLRVKDVEDHAALAKREALERVSRVEEQSVTVLAFAHEDVEGFVLKITLLED